MNRMELAYAFREAGYKREGYPVPMNKISSAIRDFLRNQYRSGITQAKCDRLGLYGPSN